MNIVCEPTFEEFKTLARGSNLVPVSAELIADSETPISAFQKLSGNGLSYLLESAETTDHVGRFSFLGIEPILTFEASGKEVTVTRTGSAPVTRVIDGDPLAELRDLMSAYECAVRLPYPFSGGAVGFLSYDAVRYFEPTVASPPPDNLHIPDMMFMVAKVVVIFDHRRRRMRIVSHAVLDSDLEHRNLESAYQSAVESIERVVARLNEPGTLPLLSAAPGSVHLEASSNTTREEYENMVRAAHEYIRAGDIFQVVLSQRFEMPYAGDPLLLYRALRFVNPSPYMFCLRFGERFSLIGSSPEIHVKCIDGNVEIRPIAGTRRRGETAEEDDRNEADLLGDPKERAEHIMLVDLARNDVGRIAEYDSVRVTDLMTIERYSHVMHIVSHVIGKLREGSNSYDVLRATFPAGTVSGSPKVRAMQIIDELEKNKRCSYAGAVGYFGFDGNLDSCITLRTVLMKDGKAYVQAGAGVVADSTPEGEYQETVNKAMGMVRAVEIASRTATEVKP
jgi:anthranilate synthase component 1